MPLDPDDGVAVENDEDNREKLIQKILDMMTDDDIREMAGRLCLSKDKRFTKQRMGVKTERGMRMPRWTATEIARLRELYCGSDNLAVARELGRSVASVANKANQLGLRKDPQLLAQIGRKNVALRYLPVEDD